jgi:hypothetical protein
MRELDSDIFVKIASSSSTILPPMERSFGLSVGDGTRSRSSSFENRNRFRVHLKDGKVRGFLGFFARTPAEEGASDGAVPSPAGSSPYGANREQTASG